MRGVGTRGRLEGCDVAFNGDCGVHVAMKGDPTLAGCTLRGHWRSGSKACGVFVDPTARGKGRVGADCVFTRNTGGDILGMTRWV